MAFLVAAAPGVLIALTIWFTVREPPRTTSPKSATMLSEILEGISLVGRIASFRRLSIAASLYGLSAYGIHTWMPVYFIRYHDMTTGEAGTIISLIVGVLGAIGAIAGGALCSKLNQRDLRWSCWLPALAIGISLPLLIAMLITDNSTLAIGLFIIPGALSSIYAGPTWSLVQELVPNHKRAIAASIYLMIYNLIGLGLGPLFVGMLSDLYIPHLGDESLRWSMISVLMVCVLGIVFYLRTASSVLSDINLSQRK
jgi:MFS family permease